MADGPEQPLDYGRPAGAYRGAGERRPWFTAAQWAVVVVIVLIPIILVLPSLNRGHIRGDSDRARCASNLNQIGLGILLYQQENGGRYPNTLDDVLRNEQIAPEVFVCPSSNDTPAVQTTTGPAAPDVLTNGRCSYVYVGRGLTDRTVTPLTVVAYERPGNHGNGGCNVLYGDGHAEYVDANHAATLPTTNPSAATTSAP